MFLLSALSAESKKTISLRPLRLCGDYKLSNFNTLPYLRIYVLSLLWETQNNAVGIYILTKQYDIDFQINDFTALSVVDV